MTHSEYIAYINEGFSYDARTDNPDEWLRLFRMCGLALYMKSYLQSLAYWMQVNGRWVRK